MLSSIVGHIFGEASSASSARSTSVKSQVDLIFMLDCTGSMSGQIRQAQQNIVKIVTKITDSGGADVRFGLVNYRDHPPQDSTFITQVHDFTSNTKKMREYVDSASASGGGDAPEAVAAAFNDVLNMDFRQRSVKIAILIADAPPHGLGDPGDGFPNGPPDKTNIMLITRLFVERGITLYGACNTDPQTEGFYRGLCRITGGQYVNLQDATQLAEVVISGAVEEISLENVLDQVEGVEQKVLEDEPELLFNEHQRVVKITDILQKSGIKTAKTSMRSKPAPPSKDIVDTIHGTTCCADLKQFRDFRTNRSFPRTGLDVAGEDDLTKFKSGEMTLITGKQVKRCLHKLVNRKINSSSKTATTSTGTSSSSSSHSVAVEADMMDTSNPYSEVDSKEPMWQSLTGKSLVTNEKDAVTLDSSGNPCVDLFYNGFVRGAAKEKITEQIKTSILEDPKVTMGLLLHARDCREGKGEKEVVLLALEWLRTHYPKTYVQNLRNLLKVGYYKDLIVMASRAFKAGGDPLTESGEFVELTLIADDLKEDFRRITYSTKKEESEEKISLTLAGKWAPSYKTKFDSKENGRLAKRLARILFPESTTEAREYRKMLTSIRKKIKVVEALMATKQWEKIEFGKVPSRAHSNYKKAFGKHQKERYGKYLEDLKSGKEKINVGGVQPHELARPYMDNTLTKADQTIEGQFQAMLKKAGEGGKLQSSLAIVDVSASMFGDPMLVAISLGIVQSLLAPEPFKRKLISFSNNPQWHSLRGESLFEMVKEMQRMSWGVNTDLVKVFHMILGTARQHDIPQECMPQALFIFSDMQFDEATKPSLKPKYWEDRMENKFDKTSYELIKNEYKNAGYSVPQIVFWNLRGDVQDVPVTALQEGVSLVSGFSVSLFNLFLTGIDELPTPESTMKKAVEPYLKDVELDETEFPGQSKDKDVKMKSEDC